MTYPASPAGEETSRVRPDAGQFWAGVAATAVVAALVALAGILICRWTLGIPVLAPSIATPAIASIRRRSPWNTHRPAPPRGLVTSHLPHGVQAVFSRTEGGDSAIDADNGRR